MSLVGETDKPREKLISNIIFKVFRDDEGNYNFYSGWDAEKTEKTHLENIILFSTESKIGNHA